MVSTVGVSRMLRDNSTLIVAGSGGVGKTTVAAALGVAAADRPGARVMVLTVDPARRLATALGLNVDDGEAHPVDTDSAGELWVEMLDSTREWNRLISIHAPDAATRDAVLSNSLYRNVTGRFIHSHEYAAMERLHELQTSGTWDLIILDTPPSRNALDLLDAPARMRDFFRGRLLRWLTAPATSRLALAASKPFRMVADRVLGGPFLTDLADFFTLMRTMERGFVARATAVEKSLSDPSTGFVVVTTTERGPVGEATKLVDELGRRRCRVAMVVVNRTVPEFNMADSEGPLLTTDSEPDPDTVAQVEAIVKATHSHAVHAKRIEVRNLSGLPDGVPITRVPLLVSDPADVAGVSSMAEILVGAGPAVA